MGQNPGGNGFPGGTGGPCGRTGGSGSGGPRQSGGAPGQRRLGAGAALGGGHAAQQGILFEQIGQKGQRSQAVELDSLGGVTVHPFFDGLAGIVQAALDGALGGIQSGGNVLDPHLVVVVHQHAQPLGLRQVVNQLHNHLPTLGAVHGLVRDGLGIQGLEGVQQAVALLVLRNLHLPASPPEDIAAVVGRHGAEPAPEGSRLL